MMNTTFGRKIIAIATALCVLPDCATRAGARPGMRGAELSLFGAVTLNGQKAISGVTVFSDCAIVTAQGSSASVALGQLGRVELFANTNLKLGFANNRLIALLESGRARFATPAGVSVNLTEGGGSVLVDGSQATTFIVSIENGITTVITESGLTELRGRGASITKNTVGKIEAARVPQSTRKDDEDGKSHRGFWAALLVAGGVVAAAIWVVTHEKVTHENDLSFGGTITVPSG
jgi:hypothetical protein